MRNSWPKVKLGQVVTRVKEEINVHDEQTYARLTIRMNGNGIVLRDRIPGHEIRNQEAMPSHDARGESEDGRARARGAGRAGGAVGRICRSGLGVSTARRARLMGESLGD